MLYERASPKRGVAFTIMVILLAGVYRRFTTVWTAAGRLDVA